MLLIFLSHRETISRKTRTAIFLCNVVKKKPSDRELEFHSNSYTLKVRVELKW